MTTGAVAGRVSVIIPCFNARRWILDALGSVMDQQRDGVDVETIVVDDGSTDDTATIVGGRHEDVRIVSTPNRGPSAARNAGIRLATGEFLQFLDADDTLPPRKLAAQLALLRDTGSGIAYCDWRRSWLESGEFRQTEVVHRTISGDAGVTLLTDAWWPIHAYLFRTTVVEQTGGFNERLPVIQDAHFALDCALRGARFSYCPGIVVEYRMHSADQVSRRDSNAFVRDCFRSAVEVEDWWRRHGEVTVERRSALLRAYEHVARASFPRDPETFESALAALHRWEPGYVPSSPRHLAFASRLFGYRRAERVALWYRRAKALFA